MHPAREIWKRVETIHALTYFGDETTAAGKQLGLTGFWMSYFGFRAAPLGAVQPGTVEATFFNFSGSFIARWVPEVWAIAAPADLISTRVVAATESLRQFVTAEETAVRATESLSVVVGHGTTAGRPLFATNRALDPGSDPVSRLWHLCTCLREHRGDGHVAALTAAGIDGIEANVLIVADQDTSAEDLQRSRGWTADDWSDATERCAGRGLLDASGALTERGRELRANVEAVTDNLALRPFATLGDDGQRALVALLDPLALAISQSGVIRYPNPMGLPPLQAELPE